jgi:MFS family permease
MFSSLAALANYCATAGTVFLLSLYLQYVKGLPPSRAGMVLLIQPLVQTGVAPFAGRLSDRIEPRVVSSIGMLSTAAGLLMLATLGETTPIPFIAASLVLLGVGFGTFSSPNTNAVMSSVDRSLYGVASATLGTMRLTGQILSMGIVTVLLAVHVGHAVITAALHPRFLACARSSFMAFALLCLLGVFASLARGRIRTRVV